MERRGAAVFYQAKPGESFEEAADHRPPGSTPFATSYDGMTPDEVALKKMLLMALMNKIHVAISPYKCMEEAELECQTTGTLVCLTKMNTDEFHQMNAREKEDIHALVRVQPGADPELEDRFVETLCTIHKLITFQSVINRILEKRK